MESSVPPPSTFRLPPSRSPRVAIIGGGISGLAAALRITELLPHAELELFEAAGRLGGVLDTVSLDGFLVERSADNFLTTPPAAVELCRRLSIDDQLLNTDETRRRAMIVRNGRLVAIPDGFYLMVARKLWPVITSPVLSLPGKLRLLAEPLIRRRKPSPIPSRSGRGQGEGASDDESVASFARRRLGREVFERLVQPLVAGIYTADPEKLSMAATMPQFWRCERENGSLRALGTGRFASTEPVEVSDQSTPEDAIDSASGARYALFAAPKNGMASLIQSLVSCLPPDSIHLNTPVTSIQRDNNRWQLTLPLPPGEGRGEGAPFDALILAVPAHAAARLLEPCDPALATELAAIPYAGCAVVSFGFARNKIAHPLDAFGFVVPQIERRRIIAASFASLKFPSRAPDNCVLIRVFIGGAMQPELAELPDSNLRSLAQDELRELLHITGQPLLTDIARWPASMPQYHVGHLDRIAKIEELTARHTGLALAGNAYHGVGIPQCIASGQRAAEQVFSREELGDVYEK
jgi:protoporphyrinogen/coproporphyrinogen III oxidase